LSGRAVIALYLSILDAALTLYIVEFNLGAELNPLLSAALRHSGGMFIAAKLLLTVACLQVLDRHFPKSIKFVSALFAVVVAYSIGGIVVTNAA